MNLSYRWTIVALGAVLLGLALVLASRAQSLLQFQLTYGILVGLAASTFFAPMTISPFARWLITTYDWRTAMLLIGILAWVLLIPAASFVRNRPVPAADAGPGAGAALDGGITSVAQALRSPQFIILGLTFFACCAAHSGPIFHMVS